MKWRKLMNIIFRYVLVCFVLLSAISYLLFVAAVLLSKKYETTSVYTQFRSPFPKKKTAHFSFFLFKYRRQHGRKRKKQPPKMIYIYMICIDNRQSNPVYDWWRHPHSPPIKNQQISYRGIPLNALVPLVHQRWDIYSMVKVVKKVVQWNPSQ